MFLECLDPRASTQPHTQKQIFDAFVKNSQKPAVKLSIQKPIWLNFVNLFTSFCPGLYMQIVILQFLSLRFRLTEEHFLNESFRTLLMTAH